MQDFTIEEFENSMTIYYFKRDGSIHSWCTGINDLSTFGNHKKDYENGGKFEALGLVFYVLPYKRVIEPSGKICKDNYAQFDDGKLEVFDSRTRLNSLIKRRR